MNCLVLFSAPGQNPSILPPMTAAVQVDSAQDSALNYQTPTQPLRRVSWGPHPAARKSITHAISRNDLSNAGVLALV